MSRRFGFWQSYLLVAAFVIVITAPGTADPGRCIVRVHKEALQGLPLPVSTARTIDYESFLWAEVSTTELADLRSSGIRFQERTEPFAISLGGRRFDPLDQPPLPLDRSNNPPRHADLYLIQFHGPTRADWIAGLSDCGADIVQHIHPHSHIVWADAETLACLSELPVIRWVGAFEPTFRVPTWQRQIPNGIEFDVLTLWKSGIGQQDLEARNITVLRSSRLGQFDVYRVQLTSQQRLETAALPGVYSVQPVPSEVGVDGEASCQVNANNVDQNNLPIVGYASWLTTVGLDGSGVVMANVDTGIPSGNDPSDPDYLADLSNRIAACAGFSCGGAATDGHASHTAGIMAGDATSGIVLSSDDPFLRGQGVAPGSKLVEQLFDPYRFLPDGVLALMTDSVRNGALISNNSWGFAPDNWPQADGYDLREMQVDIGVRDADPSAPGNQGLTYVDTVPNRGSVQHVLGSPEEAKNGIAVGGCEMWESGQIFDFNDLTDNFGGFATTHGPAEDGRSIPHLVAPGCQVDSTNWPVSHGFRCGTSMAAPQVSGAIALFIEYYRDLPETTGDPSPAMNKAALTAVAHDLAGHLDADGNILGHRPDSKQGWGRLNLSGAVDPQVSVRYVDQTTILDNTGEQWETNFAPVDPGEPVRIMLTWTDAPGHGLGGATPAWNNDLDLIVTSGGQTYLGNNFDTNGWSQPGGTADFKNNSEAVFLAPTASSITIRVLASDINSDGVPGIGDGSDQDFALVCYNCPSDCNSNDINDSVEISGGTSSDCNANGVPDECEVDCNANGVPDGCDLSGGASLDCNINSIPDECEANQDCNGNSVTDICDIGAGTSQDCNANTVPDECESLADCNSNAVQDTCDLALRNSEDCNANGIPDECDVDCDNNGVVDACEIFIDPTLDCDSDGILETCESPFEKGACCFLGCSPNESCQNAHTACSCALIGGAFAGPQTKCRTTDCCTVPY